MIDKRAAPQGAALLFVGCTPNLSTIAAVGAPLEGRTERSEAADTSVPALFSKSCRALKRLIILRMISAFTLSSPLKRTIRYAHPSGRTVLHALLRCALFLQRFHRYAVVKAHHQQDRRRNPGASGPRFYLFATRSSSLATDL